MTRRLSDLLQLQASVGDDRLPVRAVFHDEHTMRLRQVALDAGSWLSQREVLIAVERMDRPQDDVWPTDLTAEQVQTAPEWDHAESGINLPPLVTGPFGYTFSPLLMAAGLASSLDRGMPAVPGKDRADLVQAEGGRLAGLVRSSDLVGLDAFGPSGRIGAVTDLVFDDDLRIVALLVGEGDPVNMPLDRLRHRADQGHFVFD